jgi:hypothetical protein
MTPRAPVDFRVLFPGAEPAALELLRHLLAMNPNRRATVTDALGHSYFDSIRAAVAVPDAVCDQVGAIQSPPPPSFPSRVREQGAAAAVRSAAAAAAGQGMLRRLLA